MAECNRAAYEAQPPDNLLGGKNALRRADQRRGSSSLSFSRNMGFSDEGGAPPQREKTHFCDRNHSASATSALG
jgi:hypothetical protein